MALGLATTGDRFAMQTVEQSGSGRLPTKPNPLCWCSPFLLDHNRLLWSHKGGRAAAYLAPDAAPSDNHRLKALGTE
jgi:hypothetical protein